MIGGNKVSIYNPDYKDFDARWFVFVGQNASAGEPHGQTGRMSCYGYFLAFSCKFERDEYTAHFRPNNPGEFCKNCTARTGRKFALGMTIRDYLKMLLCCDCT